MGDYVSGFCKTDHFNYRQWDRKITDNFLRQILKNVEKNRSNTLLIVSRRVLRKINKKANEELFIKVDKNLLITCFYCDFQDYICSKREQNYLIISEI